MAPARKCVSTDAEFRQVMAASLFVAQVLSKVGLVPAGGNYKTVQKRSKRLALATSHFTGKGWNAGPRYRATVPKLELETILVENSAYAFTHDLRKRLLKQGLKQHKCEECGLCKWRGQLIPLELHHVNSLNTDHRIENLQLLCPNCHAQTATHRGKN